MCRLVFLVVFTAGLVVPYVNAQEANTGRLDPIELPDELDRVLRDYEAAWKEGDAAGLAKLFTEDGFVSSHYGWLRGTEEIRGKYANAGGDLRLRAHAFAMDDSVAYIVGSYGYGDEAAEKDQGKWVLALRMGADGRWLIAADLDKTNR